MVAELENVELRSKLMQRKGFLRASQPEGIVTVAPHFIQTVGQ